MAKKSLFILLSGFLFVCNITLVAQTQSYSDIKFKLGQSYERSGDIESAVKLYKEAFSKDSSNIVIYDALKRLLIQLKQYPEAISLMEYRLKIYGKDIGTTAQLGSAYILASEEKKGLIFGIKRLSRSRITKTHTVLYRARLHKTVCSIMRSQF